MPREQREALILHVATVEFGLRGWGGASLGAIAEQAGISKTLIFAYFGTKEELFAACVDRARTMLVERVEHVVSERQPSLVMAQRVVEAIITGLGPSPRDWQVLTDRTVPEGTAAFEASRQARHTIADQVLRGFANTTDLIDLDDGIDVRILMTVWMNVVSGLVDWWIRHPDFSADEMAARAARVIGAAMSH